MAIDYEKFFEPDQLATGAAALRYTVPSIPANVKLRGGQISLTNTGTTSVTPTVYAVPSGGAAGASNVCWNKPIGPLDTVYVNLPIMKAGDMIYDKCDTATAVTIQPTGGALFS